MRVNSNFIFGKKGTKITVFNSEKSSFYTLNETASKIFIDIEKGKPVEFIVETIKAIYNVSEKEAKKDIYETIQNLIEKKILLKK